MQGEGRDEAAAVGPQVDELIGAVGRLLKQ